MGIALASQRGERASAQDLPEWDSDEDSGGDDDEASPSEERGRAYPASLGVEQAPRPGVTPYLSAAVSTDELVGGEGHTRRGHARHRRAGGGHGGGGARGHARRKGGASKAAQAVQDVGLSTTPSTSEARTLAPDHRALLTLMVNGTPRGEVVAEIEGDQIWVEASALEALAIDPGASVEERHGVRVVNLTDRFGHGSWKVDSASLELELTLDPMLLPPQRINLGTRAPDMERLGSPSLFLNYGAHLSDTDLTDPYYKLDGFGEIGFSLGPARLYSGVTWPSGGAPTRGVSNLTLDAPSRMLRLTLGDALISAGSLGGGAWIGGAQLSRSFDLDPYFVPGPTMDQQATALTPSTLEVFVNGQLVHREQVAPGQIDISNIPATTGAGDTRVVITDSLGRTRELTATYYRPESLLGVGQSEFGVGAGLVRDHLGTESWDYGALAGAGRGRVGLTDHVTLGGFAQGTLASQGGGLEAALGGQTGELTASVAASHAAGGVGSAGSVAASRLGEGADLSAWARAQSAHYSSLSLGPDDDRALVELGATASMPITGRVGVSGSVSTSEWRDSGSRLRVSASGGAELPLDLHLSLLGMWTRTGQDPSEPDSGGPDGELSAALTVSRMVGRRTSAEARASYDDSPQASVELHRSTPTGSGLGYRLGASADLEGSRRALAQVDARTRSLVSSARADADLTDLSESSFGLDVASGVVIVGRHAYLSRPLEGAYAVVRVPGVEGVRTFLNNNEVGVTDGRGDVVVTGLLPNYANRLSIADADVPLDYTVGRTERVVAPYDRSGALVTFDVSHQRLVRGVLTVDGEPASSGSIEVVSGDAESGSPLGRQGEFELTGLDRGTWTVRARTPQGPCLTTLVIPDGDGVLNLGQVACTLETAERSP